MPRGVITSRCSSRLKGRLDRRMLPGNARKYGVDAAALLNSMLSTQRARD